MSFISDINRTLGIPCTYIKQCTHDEALCLIHITWMKSISSGVKIPEELLINKLTDEQLLYFFTTFDLQNSAVWKFITVYLLQKKRGKVLRFLKPHEKSSLASLSLSYSQLIHYVTKTNYKNLWEQAWKKYHVADNMKKSKNKQDYCEALHDIMKCLYKSCKVKKVNDFLVYGFSDNYSTDDAQFEMTGETHPNILQAFCAIETDNSILLICENVSCSLRDCSMFSPSALSRSTIQPLFVIYQLIQALCSIYNAGLFMGPVTLSSIKVKENMWIQIFPKIWDYVCCEEQNICSDNAVIPSEDIENHTSDNPCTEKMKTLPPKVSDHVESSKHEEPKDSSLSSIVQGWVNGSISNYDYLLYLNKLSGRQMDNPRCHYVMPWIMDFSVPDGGWRDLTKSKFRLNKGDKQLDLIYESAVEANRSNLSNNFSNVLQDSAVTVPHHTSDVLADITYYVYKARRMPKSFLCSHVRQKWVPAEYPATIERLQEWTPDECIPEFFSDPLIFYSVHPDLSDLGIPWWSDTPEDFVIKHRKALESHHVSERLHHWIDLVFGYKLTGSSAIKSKNVCLPLVDHHTSIQNYGMIQLFSYPHPHKLSKSIFLRSLAPKTFRNLVIKTHDAKDSGDDETSSDSIGKSSFFKGFRSKSVIANSDASRSEPRPESQTIVLPKDFNPLSAASHLEAFHTFLSWFDGEKPHLNGNYDSSVLNDISVHHYQMRDMLILGCLISEIALSAYCKILPQNTSLAERYVNILKLLRLHKQDIPCSLQKVIKLLLHTTESYNQKDESFTSLPIQYPPVSTSGLPLPSPHQLLLTNIHTIPFPHYFPELYKFLLNLNRFSKNIKLLFERSSNGLETCKEIESICEKKVFYAAEQLQKLLPMLNSECINLVTPYIQEMFSCRHTALLSTWHLFGLVSQALGPQQTCRKLLKLLIKVFDTDKTSPKHLKLFHRTFLLQIIVGLGLHNFLLHFTTILIEAIGGCKDYSLMHIERDGRIEGDRKALSQVSVENKMSLNETNLFECSINKALNSSDEIICLPADIGNDEDDIFYIDANEEILNETDISDNSHKDDKDNAKFENSQTSHLTISVLPEETESKTFKSAHEANEYQSSIYSKSAPNYPSQSEWMKMNEKNHLESDNFAKDEKCISNSSVQQSLLKRIHENDSNGNLNVSDVSAESMLWLAHRLGPVLAARYLTRNLLRMLTLCYDSSEKREIVQISPESTEIEMLSISCKWLKGDVNAFKVLVCLSRIVSLYGEQFIMLQYIKHIADLLNLCRKRIPASLESGLHGAMALLQHIIPYVSDNTLMDNLQEVIIKDIVHLVLRLISSLRLVYPGGGKSRAMVAFRILDVMYIIGLRIGTEMTKKHMFGVIQKFFSCFDKVYNDKGELFDLRELLGSSIFGSTPIKEQAFDEIRETFTPEMAYLAYIPFCQLLGGSYMEKALKNNELIRQLCVQYDKSQGSYSKSQFPMSSSPSSMSSPITHRREHSLGQDESFVSGVFGKNVNVVGNRLDVRCNDDSHMLLTAGEPISSVNTNLAGSEVPKFEINLIKRKMDNCQRHLKGNWLAYWEHETGRSEKDHHFDFKQIKLQTFIGHSGAVRGIEVLDNENSFLTSSKDKTVKLWSLRSCGDGSAHTPCQWTYTQHRKSVFAVSFLNSLRLVGSCDSTVHIWDPFMGSCIKQLEPTKGSPVTVLAAMPSPSSTFLAATTNSTVKFLDARTCRYMHEFKVNVGTTGLIRSLSVSPNGNWLAVGHSTGMLSVLDVRTGLVFGTWLGHEGEVLQLKAFNNTSFITSSLDQSLTVWKFEDVQAKCNLKGPMEPVTSICFYGNEVISGTAGNRIGLHSSIDKKASYSSTRLRSDTFKGVLTTMALLPLNRLLLLGTDNGNVVLLC